MSTRVSIVGFANQRRNVVASFSSSSLVGGDPVTVPAGNHTVRIQERANASKPVVVKPKETANVAF